MKIILLSTVLVLSCGKKNSDAAGTEQVSKKDKPAEAQATPQVSPKSTEQKDSEEASLKFRDETGIDLTMLVYLPEKFLTFDRLNPNTRLELDQIIQHLSTASEKLIGDDSLRASHLLDLLKMRTSFDDYQRSMRKIARYFDVTLGIDDRQRVSLMDQERHIFLNEELIEIDSKLQTLLKNQWIIGDKVWHGANDYLVSEQSLVAEIRAENGIHILKMALHPYMESIQEFCSWTMLSYCTEDL